MGLENFWSLLKRGLNGTYVCVEPFHLFRYVDEQAFRYNNRKTWATPTDSFLRYPASPASGLPMNISPVRTGSRIRRSSEAAEQRQTKTWTRNLDG